LSTTNFRILVLKGILFILKGFGAPRTAKEATYIAELEKAIDGESKPKSKLM
jgi:hypothetical protein